MYDINMKNIKKGKRFYYIFLFAGICSVIMLMHLTVSNITKRMSLDSSVLSSGVSFDKSWDGHSKYIAIYHYNVDGKDYNCRSSVKSSYPPKKKNKVIYYNSASPEICMPKSSIFSNFLMLLFWLIPILFIRFSIINISDINGRIKVIKELNKKGKLIKNLPYRLVDTGMSSNGVPIKRIIVDYTSPSGKTVTLRGEPRYDNKLCDADLKVDLLIDENNLYRYFIDFEINRISGNLPEDYYSEDEQ